MQYVLFTDNIADLDLREVFRSARAAGFDGLDLTLRPGGHVLPENAERDLAAADIIGDEVRMTIPLVSTGITSADSPFAKQIFAAAHMRAREVKLGYWRYEPFGKTALIRQIDAARRNLEGIVALARPYHIRPSVHIHSGPILSNGPLIHDILKDFSPEDVGAYVDVMHMALEGGSSGWEMNLERLAPWVSLVGIKDFVLQPSERDSFGQQRFRTVFTAVGDGLAPIPQFFQRLKQIGFNGVVSFHSEYKKPPQPLSTPQLLERSAADLRFIKRLVATLNVTN